MDPLDLAEARRAEFLAAEETLQWRGSSREKGRGGSHRNCKAAARHPCLRRRRKLLFLCCRH